MAKYTLVDSIYLARDPYQSAPQTVSRLSPGIALPVLLLLSLGSWWALWKAVSLLISV